MAYSTIPADLESEATLLNTPKSKTKSSLLVGGVAAAAFVLGVLAATSSISTTPSVSTALSGGVDKTSLKQIQVSDTLTRASNGMCLDIPNVEKIQLKNGIPLQIYECGEWNAGWVIKHKKNDLHEGWGSWVIEWKDSGFCVDADTGNTGGEQGVQLVLWQCVGNKDQDWVYDHKGENGYAQGMDTIWLASSNPSATASGYPLCMDVAGGDIWDNKTPVQAWECSGNSAQKWTIADYY